MPPSCLVEGEGGYCRSGESKRITEGEEEEDDDEDDEDDDEEDDDEEDEMKGPDEEPEPDGLFALRSIAARGFGLGLARP